MSLAADGYELHLSVIPLPAVAALRDLMQRQPRHTLALNADGELPMDLRVSHEAAAVVNETANALFTNTPYTRVIHPSTLRAQFPDDPAPIVPAHQDASYITYLADFLTVWVPLTPITGDGGGVEMYPALFDGEQRPATRAGLWLRGLDSQGTKPVYATMLPGDAMIFHRCMIHATRPNRSTRPRFSIDMRFFPAHIPCPKPYLDLTTGEVRRDA